MKSRRRTLPSTVRLRATPVFKVYQIGAAMSALGQKQTCAVQTDMSALPPKADMCSATRDVRFGPKADIGRRHNPIDFDQKIARAIRLFGASPIRAQIEVEHVPAYPDFNRWVGVGGACSDEWIVTGGMRGSQGNRDYRRRSVRPAGRVKIERGGVASGGGEGGGRR